MKYFLLFFSLLSQTILAQTAYSGRVVDAATQESLAFVNVGIVGQNVGTVTDEQGYFQLPVNEGLMNDSIRFSMIGYQTETRLIRDLSVYYPTGIIALKAADLQLREVQINADKLKSKILGSESTSRNFTGGFTSNDLGNEVCVRINIKKSPSYLADFNFSIAHSNCDSLLFRVNVYSIKNNMPDSNLLQENVLVSTNKTSGVVHVDLLPYGIEVTDDFIIGLEYIKPCSERSLQFSAAFLGAIYSRQTSQGDWELLKGFDLGFNVRVLH